MLIGKLACDIGIKNLHFYQKFNQNIRVLYNMFMKILRSLTLTLFVFGLIGWIYIVISATVHPQTLTWPLTHLLPWPREDTFGIICFGTSFVSFFIWNLIKK
jgi:hypothetical protein